MAGIAGTCFLSNAYSGVADFQRLAALPSKGYNLEFPLLLQPEVNGGLSENIYIPHYEKTHGQQKSTMPNIPSERTLDSHVLKFDEKKNKEIEYQDKN